MGDGTGISWTDATWNPIRGCSRVSEGCRNCYAETVAARFSGPGQPYEGLADRSRSGSKWTGDVRFIDEHLADPLRWRKPRRIFVNSMSDLFHEKLTNEQIAAVFGVMAACPQHTFQVLTKRAKRMREWFEWVTEAWPSLEPMHATVEPDSNVVLAYLPKGEPFDGWLQLHGDSFAQSWPLPNVWLGVSVENQAAAVERIPHLLATPASIRFLSCEPLLGAVDLTAIGTWRTELLSVLEEQVGHVERPAIDWVIAGCESGHGARACDVAWLRSLRDQCTAANVPLFLKQAVATDIGRCGDADNPNGDNPCGKTITAFVYGPGSASYSCDCCVEGAEDGDSPAVGFGDGSKRKQGGIVELPYLDGVQHAEFPTAKEQGQ